MGTSRALTLGVLLAAAIQAQATQPSPSREELVRAIKALESPDAKVVEVALAKLVAGGGASLPLLTERLREPEAAEDAGDEFQVRFGGRSWGSQTSRGNPNDLLLWNLRVEDREHTDHAHGMMESEVSELSGTSDPTWIGKSRALEALRRLGSTAASSWIELLAIPDLQALASAELEKLGKAAAPALEAEFARVPRDQIANRTTLWSAWTRIRSPLPPPLVDEAIAELKRQDDPSTVPLEIVLSALFTGRSEYAVDAALALTADPSSGVRGAAVALLALWKPEAPTVHAKLLAFLDDPDLDVRRYGAHGAVSCARNDTQRATTLAALRPHLTSSVPQLRECALRQIGRLGAYARSETPALLAGLDDRYPFARAAALGAIEQVADPAAVPVKRVAARVRDRSDGVARAAFATLAWIGEPALDALASLHESDRFSPFELGIAIGRIGKPAVPKLTALLQSEEGTAELIATIGLCETLSKSDAALDTLLEVARTGQSEARTHVLRMLPRSHPPLEKVLPIYAHALEDEECDIRRQAAAGIARIGVGAEPLAKKLAELLPDAEENEGLLLMTALEAIGKRAGAARPALEQYLRSDAAQDAANADLVRRSKALLATFAEAK